MNNEPENFTFVDNNNTVSYKNQNHHLPNPQSYYLKFDKYPENDKYYCYNIVTPTTNDRYEIIYDVTRNILFIRGDFYYCNTNLNTQHALSMLAKNDMTYVTFDLNKDANTLTNKVKALTHNFDFLGFIKDFKEQNKNIWYKYLKKNNES